MVWDSDQAWRTCGDLLQSLLDSLPEMKWEKAGADGDDGLIYFTNDNGEPVKVKIFREALEDYLDQDERGQSRKRLRLANCIAKIKLEGITEALITSEHLGP